MLPLTLAIITRDEASRISQAIASVGVVAEILVLDSGSTDETVAIARGLGARVEQVDWPGYGAQKNRALEMAQQDWVLSIDADEVLSEDLCGALRFGLWALESSMCGPGTWARAWGHGVWRSAI